MTINRSPAVWMVIIVLMTAMIVAGCTQEEKAAQTPVATQDITPVSKTEITVFAAGALKDSFNELKANYEKKHEGVIITSTFDSSPNLKTQIEQGAKADIFASAAQQHMNSLKSNGYMNNSTVVNFVSNKVAVIVPKDNPAGIVGLQDLVKPGIKISFGTNEIPIYNYTIYTLDKMSNDTAYGKDYKDKVMGNVVTKENTVNYIVSKVALGEVDAGFVYVSDVPKEYKDKVTMIEIPDTYQPSIVWPIGVLKDSTHQDASQGFIAYIRSDEGKAILQKYGFMQA